jgi:hypothetical protein
MNSSYSPHAVAAVHAGAEALAEYGRHLESGQMYNGALSAFQRFERGNGRRRNRDN